MGGTLMNEPAEVVDVDEVVEASSDLVPVATPVGQVSIYASQDPAKQLEEAMARAAILVQVVKDQGLAKNLGGDRPHVSVEGWTFLASQFGLIPDVEWTRPLPDGWEARVALRRMSDGVAISHAESECRSAESNWKDSDSYAVRSGRGAVRSDQRPDRLAGAGDSRGADTGEGVLASPENRQPRAENRLRPRRGGYGRRHCGFVFGCLAGVRAKAKADRFDRQTLQRSV